MNKFQVSLELRQLGLAVLLLCISCGDDGKADGGSEAGSDDGIPTTTDPGDGDGDGDAASTCGDGVVEGDEQCDDGNVMSGDGCSDACTNESDGGPIECEGTIYQCGDGIDNDDDGLIDLDDHECISPCDDDESSFATDLPGQNQDCKQDCYFDSNSGGGDDQCDWNMKCDPENPGEGTMCEYDPNFHMCDLELPDACLEACVPYIPNGCDCFGCCLIEGQFVHLEVGDCSLDNLDACQSCTFYENCNNGCDPCEVCFGQDPEDLPEECGEPECPPGIQSCLDTDDCPLDFFCQTGCCIPINIP